MSRPVHRDHTKLVLLPVTLIGDGRRPRYTGNCVGLSIVDFRIEVVIWSVHPLIYMTQILFCR